MSEEKKPEKEGELSEGDLDKVVGGVDSVFVEAGEGATLDSGLTDGVPTPEITVVTPQGTLEPGPPRRRAQR